VVSAAGTRARGVVEAGEGRVAYGEELAGDTNEDEEEDDATAAVERALSLVALLREAVEVRAPPGVPCEGRVVNFDSAVRFVARHRRLAREHGPEVACPRVTFHWTAEENFQSIVESNLRVPDRPAAFSGGGSADAETGAAVKRRHGAAFGRGIYTCPDYRMAREDFAYGARATFVCLALPGRQRVRQHRPRQGHLACGGADFDSVVGKLPGRYVDTWVFPDSDLLLPCFLVDEVAIPAAVEKLREASALLREPWRDDAVRSVELCTHVVRPDSVEASQLGDEMEASCDTQEAAETAQVSRWRRSRGTVPQTAAGDGIARFRSGDAEVDFTPEQFDAHASSAGTCVASVSSRTLSLLPYGGNIQEAIRAQDRQAIRELLATRDAAERGQAPEKALGEGVVGHAIAAPLTSPTTAAAAQGTGRRWGPRGAASQAPASSSPGCSEGDTAALDAMPLLACKKLPTQRVAGALLQRGGDLLAADEEFIVHQCNCVFAGSAQGVAEAIFAAFPIADVYKERATGSRPVDVPGTVSVHGRIVNLYGQLLPGRPADDAPSGGWPGTARYVGAAAAAEDTRAARFRWFEACIMALPRALPGEGGHSLAFPARIGCGLAGGRWPQYLMLLRRFAQVHPHWHVTVYDIDAPAQQILSKGAHADIGDETTDVIHRGSATIDTFPEGHLSTPPVCGSLCDALGPGRFWGTVLFESFRDGAWCPYEVPEQKILCSALRSADACDDVLSDAARQAALSMLARPANSRTTEEGILVASADGTASDDPLAVHLHAGGASVVVLLGAIVAGTGFGEERRITGDNVQSGAPVRLRLPPVREGEVRLPEELDECGATRRPRDCGRVVDGAAELAALAGASGRCGICLGELTGSEKPRRGGEPSTPVILLSCGHPFHEACLTRWFDERRACPSCKRRFGHIVGHQPRVGTMRWRLESGLRLAGFADCFTIVLHFRFPPGWDESGQRYQGRTQRAYLPHNERGLLLLELFQLAFRRRVLFDLRVSATDAKYWPAFNIHLKTATTGGPQKFGFPDESYFQRAMEELRESGVTVAELE